MLILFSTEQLESVLQEWSALLGGQPGVDAEQPGRELWPVTAVDGRRYFLKRLGPWRNLPVADQARVLSFLTANGVRVAAFMITDDARVFAGEVENSFVLLPHLDHDHLLPPDALAMEQIVGRSVATLHHTLASYPWPANPYCEQIVESLTGELALPADLADAFGRARSSVVDRLGSLPLQLVHGDLTPDNILVARGDDAAAFIDFDHLPLAPRMWDVGKYLGRRLRHPAPADVLPTITLFVAGYHQTKPLTDDELEAVPAATIAVNVLETDWMTRIASGQLERRQLPGQDVDLRITVDTLRWQLDHEQVLLEAVYRGQASRAAEGARDARTRS